MRWIGGLTKEGRDDKQTKREARRMKWHLWFAWYPVAIIRDSDGNGRMRKEWIWLERVFRKGYYKTGRIDGRYIWTWEYSSDDCKPKWV